ncbi:peptidoglycan-binding domain-containing protein [Peribacillus sp. NPDC097895]|uniref:peptidoglycan-binding domain-containing protein n=1 Tax=Peribacillus sp. NPDC097895 TaxID=3390619 RepID=UPI003D052668
MKEKAKGMKVVDIKRVQRASGMVEKDVDGKFGPKTTKAVKVYQKKQGLKIDGPKLGIGCFKSMIQIPSPYIKKLSNWKPESFLFFIIFYKGWTIL